MKTKPFIAMTTCLALLLAAGLCNAGIPEPETLIFGDVYNTAGGKRIPVTAGTVSWSLKGRQEEAGRYDLQTPVECIDCEVYSDGACASCNDYGYQLAVPQEAVDFGLEAAADAVPLTADNRQYDYLAVTVDGAPAKLVLMGQYGNARPDEPAGEFILAGQERRLHYYQVDLEVTEPPADADGDGLPDYWETEHGLDPNDPTDAELDPDGDGWANLAEYANNADPNQDNRIPSLPANSVRASERGRTQFQLAILDADTPPESVRVELTALPEGLSLTVFGDASAGESGARLAVGDVMTLQDMIGGNILMDCGGAAVRRPVIGLRISDENHEPVAADVTVLVYRPSDENGTDALLWSDAAHFAAGLADGANPRVFPDRSGNEFDGDAYYWSEDGSYLEFDLTHSPDAPTGRPAVDFNGASWLELPYGENIFPDGDSTFVAVFRAAGAEDGILASGPYFEVGVTGADHPSHPNEIRVSTESETVYGNLPVTHDWIILTVRRQDGRAHILIDGLWTGGPQTLPAVRTLGTDPVIGARTEWTRDFDDNKWVLETHEIFQGDLGEMLVFNRRLPPAKEWGIQAYLRTKWFGAVVNDQSDATSSQRLMAASSVEWTRRKALVDAAYDAYWPTYDEAIRYGEGVEEALAAFEALVPDHAPWVENPPTSEEVWQAYIAFRDATLFDYERDFVAKYGPEPSYVLIGGFAGDDITGGFEDDLLVGGPGPDHFRGLAGRDIFVVGDGDTIHDFNRSDGDTIDISGLIADKSQPLSACIRMELVNDPEAEDVHTMMRIDADGDGSGFDDAEILLRSVVLRDTDLPGLWAGGFLQTGGVRPQLSLSIEASSAEAMEIGGPPGILSLSFSNSNVPADLTVPLTFSGDAELGVDYRLEALMYDPETDSYQPVPLENGRIPVQLKPGDTILTVNLIPVADGENELVETARIGLMPKSGYYALGEPSSAVVNISDGPDEVRINATGPTAHESGQVTGRVTLSRTGTVADALMVRLSIQGTAVNGTDYEFLPSEVRIPAGQVTATFPVAAKADAETEPEEYAEIFVIGGDGYVVAGPSSVRVTILDKTAPIPSPTEDADGDGLPDEWEARYGLDPATADAGADPDGDGFTNLEEYNCGTDPTDDVSVPAPPLADAGPDQVAAPGEIMKLSALNSIGANEEDLFFFWQQIGDEAPPVDLANADSAQPSVAAPENFTGALTFELIVSNLCGEEETADCVVNVTADGAVPVAKAAETVTVVASPAEKFSLDADLSKNADGTADGLAYRWTQIDGPKVELSDAAAKSPTFTTPDKDAALVFELEVIDENGLKVRDRMTVNVIDDESGAHPPQAAPAASADSVNEGTMVTLDAGIEQENVSWQWRQISGPPAALSDPTSRTPTFDAPEIGPEGAELIFEVVVKDNETRLEDRAQTTVKVLNVADDETPDEEYESEGGSGGGGGGCFIESLSKPSKPQERR